LIGKIGSKEFRTVRTARQTYRSLCVFTTVFVTAHDENMGTHFNQSASRDQANAAGTAGHHAVFITKLFVSCHCVGDPPAQLLPLSLLEI
jgi:hypothetical protein